MDKKPSSAQVRAAVEVLAHYLLLRFGSLSFLFEHKRVRRVIPSYKVEPLEQPPPDFDEVASTHEARQLIDTIGTYFGYRSGVVIASIKDGKAMIYRVEPHYVEDSS